MEQLLNPGTLAMLIPIVAIIGSFVYKIKRMEIERNSGALVDEIEALHDEVLSLRRRMENVEAIVSTEDSRIDIDDPVNERNDSKQNADQSGLKNMLR